MKTVIVSLAAKNIHKSLAPWCLKSYCVSKGLQDIEIIEDNINKNIGEIVGRICGTKPDIIAFSCYIWNIDYVNKIGKLIKQLIPESVIILGGPEVSFEENLSGYLFADFIIRGAGEEAFYGLVRILEDGISPHGKVIDGNACAFNSYPMPYSGEYFESFDKNQLPLVNQLIYYESSRGCPFSCSYCLSSASSGVQYLEIERVKSELLLLTQKGARCIKFVDRTFNAHAKRAKQILEFILSLDTDCTFHFEAAADLFDDGLFAIIEKMPAGRVQFEIGIQSVNEQVLSAINRKTDTALALANIKKLTGFGNCHVHVDLIAGLPHETMATFKEGIDECISANPHMLQLGFLKMLKGTRLRRENENFGAVFADFAPYEVYQTETLPCEEILELKKIESVIDKFYNSGAFSSSFDYAFAKLFPSPYTFFKELSDFCPDVFNLKISFKNAYTLLTDFLLKYGEKAEVLHHIKLDCLSQDSHGLLPDIIVPQRNKQAETLYRQQSAKKSANIRIEFFEFDNKYRLFDYDNKNILKNRFEIRDLDIII